METNVPKTCRNAAKVYYKLKFEQMDILEKFNDTNVIRFFQSISQDDIDDKFNPF